MIITRTRLASARLAILLAATATAHAQVPDTSTASSARQPAHENFFTRLVRGIDQLNTAVNRSQMDRATSIDVERRGALPVPYYGAMLGVSRVDLRDGVGVRLHLYVHNTSDQTLTLPVPARAMFALFDERGHRLNKVDSLDAEVERGSRAPRVENGMLVLPALERVSYTLLFQPAASDANEVALRVKDVGVVRGLPAHPGSTSQAYAQPYPQAYPQPYGQLVSTQPAGVPNPQPVPMSRQPAPGPVPAAGSGSPPER